MDSQIDQLDVNYVVDLLVCSSDQDLINKVTAITDQKHTIRHATTAKMVSDVLAKNRDTIGVVLIDSHSLANEKSSIIATAARATPFLVCIFIKNEILNHVFKSDSVSSVRYFTLSRYFSNEEGCFTINAALRRHYDLRSQASKRNASPELTNQFNDYNPALIIDEAKSSTNINENVLDEIPFDVVEEIVLDNGENIPELSASDFFVNKTAAREATKKDPKATLLQQILPWNEQRNTKLIATSTATILGFAIGLYLLIDLTFQENSKHIATDTQLETNIDEKELKARALQAEKLLTEKIQIDALLSQAAAAMQIGNYFEPEENNALFFYTKVSELAPNTPNVRNEINQFIDVMIEYAHAEIVNHHLQQAFNTVENIRKLRPNDPRFRNFDNQLKQQVNITIASANELAEIGEINIAKRMLTEVSAILNIDLESLISLKADISIKIKKQDEANKTASLVKERLKEGKLIYPTNDSAKHYLYVLQKLAPENAEIEIGLEQLGYKLIERFDAGIEQGDLEKAEQWLKETQSLDMLHDETAKRVITLDKAIEKQQLIIAEQKQRQLIIEEKNQQQLTAALLEKLQIQIENRAFVSPENDNAKYTLEQLIETIPNDPRTKKASTLFNQAIVNEIEMAIKTDQFVRAEILLVSADIPGIDEEIASLKDLLRSKQLAITKIDSLAKNEHKKLEEAIVDNLISSYRIVHKTSPGYPKRALRKGIEGWVHVNFMIDANGITYDHKVVEAEPQGIFDKAALNAVKKWKYEFEIKEKTNSENYNFSKDVRLEFKME